MMNRSDTRVSPGLMSRFRGRGDVPRLAAVRWPVGWRCVAVAFLLAVLAGLAYETGRPGAGGPTFSKQVQYVITTVTKPAVAIPLASVIVLAVASLLRRLRFEWLVYKPGPICVRELAVAPGVCDIDVTHLATLFRGRLMQLRLHAPTPVPGATPAEDFLAVLDAGQLDAKNMLGSVVSVVRAAIPTHGYEVSVTLTQQGTGPPGKPRLGVTTQLTRLPNEGVPIETAWAYSWDEAVTQAADMVTAAVLPRTRLSNRAPWSGWRRYQMPALLVHRYEKAQELTSARRYDEALSHCFQALQLDPKNVDLRLCKGFIEEKLGLYLDAVATYASARRVADDTARRLYNRRARRNRRASGRIARYRLAVLLSGPNFAHQWRKTGGAARRARQRSVLRERLNPELERLLEQHKLLSRGTPEEARILDLLKDPVRRGVKEDADPPYYELRHVLGQLAARELRGLQHSLNWHRTQPGSLTPLSVKLTATAVHLRLRYIPFREGGGAASATPLSDSRCRPEVVVGRWRRAFQTWTEEYSAASLYALPLLIKQHRSADELTEADAAALEEEERRHTELAHRAVAHLRRAMSSTPSMHAADRRDWILSEDPDLDGLRSSLAFKHFEAIFFPSPAPTARRPRRASRWEISAYTNALLVDAARRWEMVWHQRRELVISKVDPHTVIQWSKDEAGVWATIARMARDYTHWPARYELIEQMREWSARYGFEPLDVSLPRFVRDNGSGHDGDGDYEALCREVKDEVKVNQARLRTLMDQLDPITGYGFDGDHATAAPRTSGVDRDHRLWARVTAPLRLGEPPVRQFERLQDELSDRDFWHRAAPSPFLESVCDVHAALWQRLHEWLEEPVDSASATDTEFICAIAQAARLSETSGTRWVRAVIARRVQRLGSADTGGRALATNGASAIAR